jgi:hypothetical protein
MRNLLEIFKKHTGPKIGEITILDGYIDEVKLIVAPTASSFKAVIMAHDLLDCWQYLRIIPVLVFLIRFKTVIFQTTIILRRAETFA